MMCILTPVAYWSFNETHGNKVADSAGTPRDGTFFARHPDLDDPGPPDSVALFGAGTGDDFHGTTKEYIAVAHDPALELAGGTVQLWFNTRHTWGDQTLFSKDHAGFADGGHLDISLDGSRIEVRLQGSETSYTIRTDKLVHSGTWYHLAFTFGNGGMQLYLNGEQVGKNDFSGDILGNREPIVIGGSLKWNTRDTDDLSKLHIRKLFNGRIDEVAIYGQALDSAQIGQLITRGPRGLFVGGPVSGS